MNYSRRWTDFTYLFKTRKPNYDIPYVQITQPDSAITARRRKLEERREQRELRQQLADVWE